MEHTAGEDLRRSPPWLWIVAAAIGLLLVGHSVVSAGTWLDEYWQLWISGASNEALPSRLAADAHPPWFNLMARPVVLATAGAIIPARLINLGAAIAVLAIGLWRLPALDAGLRWRILLLTAASGGVAGMTELAASFRVYPWLLVLAVLQATVLAALALKRPVSPVLALFVTAVSICVHYVHAAGAIAIAAVSIGVAWRTTSGAVRPLLAGLTAGIALNLLTGFAQLSQWQANFDVNWIAQGGGDNPFGTFASVGLNFVIGNAVAAVLLVFAFASRRSGPVLLILAPIPLALVAWLALDSATPLLVPRYLASVTALLVVASAVGWYALALSPAMNAVLAVLAALQPLASNRIWPPLPGWEAGARVAARTVRACPQAPLYAVSAWRFRDQPDSRSAQFEDPVFELAYRRVGANFGLDPTFVRSPTDLRLGRCPAILWMEAAHGISGVPVDVVLKRAQLRLTGPAQVRVIATPNGAVLLIAPADRLQRRP